MHKEIKLVQIVVIHDFAVVMYDVHSVNYNV